MAPTEPSAGSLLWRSAMAIGLTVAFYAFALGLAAFLLWIAWADLHAKHVSARLVLFCALGGIVILWSIVPRPAKFEVPGPSLLPGAQPRLFEEIGRVARATGQPLPAEVYLVPDLNAAVAQVGGFLGTGGRRVMLLGLPLVALLRVSELRGVLCHEFGHYHAGDTRLGPFIWKTREAIGRTVVNLAQAGSLLRFVFVAYGKAFLRISQAVSRRQELDADRLAAAVAGPASMARGLRVTHAGARAYPAFLQEELFPVLSTGFLPPIAEGFRRYFEAAPVVKVLEEEVRKEVHEGKADPYDSHPPLRERLRALGGETPCAPDPADPPALSLLADVPALERALVSFAFRGPGMERLRPLPWEAAVESVYLPAWRKRVDADGAWLAGVRTQDLPAAMHGWMAAAAKKVKSVAGGPPPAVAASWTAAAALVLALHERGWTVRSAPGEPVLLEREGRSLRPFEEMTDVAFGRTTREAWAKRCAELELAGWSPRERA